MPKITIMTNEKAIKILQQQINKLKSNKANRSYSWTNETRAYIIQFFGEKSSQNDYFNFFNSWWIPHPSIGSNLPTSIDDLEKSVIDFLESCIDIIKNIGIAKKPK